MFTSFLDLCKQILPKAKDSKGVLSNMGEVQYEVYLIHKNAGENEKAMDALKEHE